MNNWQKNIKKVKIFFRSSQNKGFSVFAAPWITLAAGVELQKLCIEGVICKKMSALDIGCSIGTEGMFLAKQGLKVTGIDFISENIETAKILSKNLGTEINFIHGDFLEMPINKLKNSFDIIIDQGCFHHIPIKKRDIYAKKVFDLLSENGLFFLRGFSEYVLPIPKYGGPIRLTADNILNAFNKYLSLERMYRFKNIPRPDNNKPQIFWAYLGKKRNKILL